MEITKQTPLLTGGDDQEKLRNTQGTENLEENGNIALNAGGKAQTTTDNTASRAVDQFFARQARGDILSPIKAGAIKDDAATESLDLKLDESYSERCHIEGPSKSRSACVQPDSSMMEPTDLFEVNILETTVDSKLDADQSQTDLLNESASSRKRPQTEMEPAVFEVPRMTKHPHTDAPPVPEFREDSEPLIQFSSDTENVFRVALRGENADDTVEPMSFQEHSEVSTPGGERVAPFGETFDKCSATFDKEPAECDAELLNDNRTQDGHKTSAGASASDASVAARSSPVPMKSEGSVSSSLLQSIDEALDPLVRAVFPIMRRGTGLNTAFVCIPLVVASIIYFYFRN